MHIKEGCITSYMKTMAVTEYVKLSGLINSIYFNFQWHCKTKVNVNLCSMTF